MGKKRTRLGKAELPKSLTQFLEADHDQLSVSLLLNYIEELERVNGNYHADWQSLNNKYQKLDQRLEAVELALERASGTRILKPLTQKEIRERKLDKALEPELGPWKQSVYGRKAKGTRRH